MSVSDELLMAFLDGELSASETSRIKTELQSNPQLKQRLDDLDSNFKPVVALTKNDDVRFGGKVLYNESYNLKMSKQWRSALSFAVSCCLALVIGFMIGRETADKNPDGFIQNIMGYHGFYSAETLAGTGAQVDDLTVDDLSNKLELKLNRGEFAIDGLSYKYSRMLMLNGKPLAQFVFQSTNGVPVGVFISRSKQLDNHMDVQKVKGLHTAHWHKHDCDFVVIGDIEEALLRQTVEQIFTNT